MSLIKHKLLTNACKHSIAEFYIKWHLFTVTSKPRVFWLAQLDFIFVAKCQLKLETLQIKTKGLAHDCTISKIYQDNSMS